jgi:hypothetical protein
MQVGSVNVIPQSSNHMIVSLNGVIQKPGGANPSFTVSGAVITFSSNLVTNDVIDFIQILGDVLDLGTPSDNTVTATKLSSNAVTTAKINNDAVTVDKLNLISTGSVPSLEAKGTSGVTEGYIQLNCAENTHGIKIKSPPHSAGASYTLTMPNNDGDADQFLQTNGSGVLSFAAAGGGGKIGQVVSTTKTDTFSASIASNDDSAVTGLTVNITPSASNSKVLVFYSVMGASSTGNRQATIPIRLYRDSSAAPLGDSAGNRGRITALQSTNAVDDGNVAVTVSGNYLDSPSSTSQVTYSIRIFNISNSSTAYSVNRTDGDGDYNNFRPRGTSTITVMEVLA